MEQNKIWLSTSLFCAKQHWNELLATGIMGFVDNNSLQGRTFFNFNYLCGENIRFSVLAEKEDAPDIAIRADNYFKNYFGASGFSVNEIKLPVNGIFMPFPANTIQYGLYPPVVLNEHQVDTYLHIIKLSEITLEALKHDCIDDETIITFAFYLWIGLINSIDTIDPHFTKRLKTILSKKNAFTALDINIITSKFAESKEMLLEITGDIRGVTTNATLPPWFMHWLDVCASILSDPNVPAEVGYNKLTAIITTQLGITPEMYSMLTYFIEHAFFYETEIEH